MLCARKVEKERKLLLLLFMPWLISVGSPPLFIAVIFSVYLGKGAVILPWWLINGPQLSLDYCGVLLGFIVLPLSVTFGVPYIKFLFIYAIIMSFNITTLFCKMRSMPSSQAMDCDFLPRWKLSRTELTCRKMLYSHHKNTALLNRKEWWRESIIID